MNVFIEIEINTELKVFYHGEVLRMIALVVIKTVQIISSQPRNHHVQLMNAVVETRELRFL